MQKFCWFVLSVGCAIFTDGAGGAYLPHLGPSPVRFQTAAPAKAIAPTLPPLRMDDTILVPTNAVADPATNYPPIETLEPLGPTWPGAASLTPAATPTNFMAAPTTQPLVAIEGSPAITPQMLADFFQQHPVGTNAAAVSPWAGSFVPPSPPSSSATYRSR